ncbi:MAG: dUTP diphosphatase [Patescibacteria group bacterium]
MKVKIKKLHKDAVVPKYAHEGDAGVDFFAITKHSLKSGERCLVGTGLSFEFPNGYELQIRPRSGLALKKGISIVNTPGTLDAGYRGELGIIIINHGQEDFEINPGDKIAQGVFNKIEICEFEEVGELSETTRGGGGFGSTGLKK